MSGRQSSYHHAHYEALKALREFSHPQEMILRAIHLQTVAKDRPSAEMPRSSTAKLAGLSETATKKNLDKLVEAGYVDRCYVCHTCGSIVGFIFSEISIGRCPYCDHYLHKKVWVRLKLSSRGLAKVSLFSVQPINNEERPLSTSALTWASRAARLLGVDNPSQVEALARFRTHERALVRVESDWELALAYACERNRCHAGSAKTVISLVGVMRWALREVIANAPRSEGRFPCELSLEVKARLNYVIDHMQSIEASNLPEDSKHTERLILMLYVNDTIQDNPAMATSVDRMVGEAGLEPRSLLPRHSARSAQSA